MTPQCSTHNRDRLHAARPRVLKTSMKTVALGTLVGLAGPMLVAPTGASAAPSGQGPFAPGRVVVAQGGAIFGGSGGGNGVEANGEVDIYQPDANGDVAPEASFTNGMYGPTTLVFDHAGDLWVANENTSDLFELTKAQLATHDPVPAVTIFAESGALANPFGMAFDPSGNLWVVSNGWGKVYEYTKAQLASSGAPTPTIPFRTSGAPRSSESPSTPRGDLWVSTEDSVVEFSRAELATAAPAPTITISSSGGAQLVFDPSGDLWMVTGGGPDCFGTPCTNQVVEYTKAQLSTSGSPTPAVTISSANVGTYQSLDGPYSLAFDHTGDLWVENFDGNTTVEFGRDQLSTSGSPTPVRAIVGPKTAMNSPSYVVIEP